MKPVSYRQLFFWFLQRMAKEESSISSETPSNKPAGKQTDAYQTLVATTTVAEKKPRGTWDAPTKTQDSEPPPEVETKSTSTTARTDDGACPVATRSRVPTVSTLLLLT